MVKSIVTHSRALETQISQLAHISLGPFPEGHVNVVTTRSGKQVENSRQNDKEVEESSDQKNVEIEENPLTPHKQEVVKEVEKETPYVSPLFYKPPPCSRTQALNKSSND